MNASRVWWHEWLHANLSVNKTKDACVFPSRPRPASRSNRPDTYQRLPLSTHNLSCETQPVHTFVPRTDSRFTVLRAHHLPCKSYCAGAGMGRMLDTLQPLGVFTKI